MKQFLMTAAALLLPTAALADIEVRTLTPASLTAEQSETCVTMMSGFPDDSPESRYVFFRLSQELAKDVTPELSQLMTDFMIDNETRRLPADWPMLDVIEDIADPVLRQAAPTQTVASMAHIAYFNALCGPFVQGQVDSLFAFNPALADTDIMIREDALYLRQILAEALDRLGASDTMAAQAYALSLVIERDDIEYIGFEDEIGELETLYMGDLDTKLSRSNDAVNEGMNVESFQDAVALANDMNDQAREQAQKERLYSLVRILGGIG
ncbi:hypothetical protein GCM10009069_16180 [Algimonas arctica]|uniref:Uncharacterized protein n=1 Tax=Algimonas arctica TaxID=1479486 RepID=A0A8J3G2I4_9PROT|nr:hypothetical protein [Algimonas arctica]GHA93852.1 hypothetical protein GCM10009069_16180 [Algimonas arctica]